MSQERDHLFISYAWEDEAVAEWLALKLTAAGYRIWCDRFKLLGGESYPADIDRAIKDQTFRLLALLSKHSVNKPNPRKERTLALNLARQRGEDFLIPLNVDGLRPTDLDWMLSDLSYISFDQSWAGGLTQLLKKLSSINAPCPLANGGNIVSEWLGTEEVVTDSPEPLWSNLFELTQLPPSLLRIEFAEPVPAEVTETWPYFRENDFSYWAFEAPPQTAALDIVDLDSVDWSPTETPRESRLHTIAKVLTRRHVRQVLLERGLRETPDGGYLYFPSGLLANDRLHYRSYDGRRTWLQAVGERNARRSSGQHRSYRYHLSPTFTPELSRYDVPVLQARMRVYLTTSEGVPLAGRTLVQARKAVARSWWNHEWLCRLLAVPDWLARGDEQIPLGRTGSVPFALAARPLRIVAPVGIDEHLLGDLQIDDVNASLPDEFDALDDEDEWGEEDDRDG